MDKEKLNKKLEELHKKIRLKTNQITDSSKYKLLEYTQKEWANKISKKRKEKKVLEALIYKKYAYTIRGKTYGDLSFQTKDIKSSVKQGIKKGLGITNVALINEYDLRDIVIQLIDKDLEKIKKQINKLNCEIDEIAMQLNKCYDNKEKIIIKGLGILEKQQQKIYNELNSERIIREEKKRELRIKVKKHLPEFMDKIAEEVNRRVILEGLEE